MEMMRARGITVHAGGKELIRDVSLTLRAGDWLMVAGPNGAGKTTLLRALAQTVPYTGEVFVQGVEAKELSPREFSLRVATLEQSHAPQMPFTVRQLAEMGRYAHKRVLREDPDGEAKVQEALRVCGLLGMEHQSLLTLSGGELQRAFLARVIAQDAPILLLDEPTGHLDLKFIQEIFTMVGEWLKTPGRAVLSVVHDVQLAMRFGTRALLLGGGRVEAFGAVGDALSPANLRRVYGMDVMSWLDSLSGAWRGQNAEDSL